MKNKLPSGILNLFIDKLFLFFMAIGFIFLLCLIVVGGIFLYHGISEIFLNGLTDFQIEKSMQNVIEGIEFIFISSVPYLLVMSIHNYFKVMFPIVPIHSGSSISEPNYETVRKHGRIFFLSGH